MLFCVLLLLWRFCWPGSEIFSRKIYDSNLHKKFNQNGSYEKNKLWHDLSQHQQHGKNCRQGRPTRATKVLRNRVVWFGLLYKPLYLGQIAIKLHPAASHFNIGDAIEFIGRVEPDLTVQDLSGEPILFGENFGTLHA